MNNSNINTQIVESKGYVFVDFYADWCGPCKNMDPLLEQFVKNNQNIQFYKVNIDNDRDFAIKESIRAVPTFILYKDGNEVGRFSGAILNYVDFKTKIKEIADIEVA